MEEIENEPLWFKKAIFYQIHVKSFFDSNNDGLGDFKGLQEKLEYLEFLGITAIWLLPFYPSPLRDDGYDIADYFSINPAYGTLRDFKNFLREAHRRGIRVIVELIMNHTSDQHPWFQRARRSPPDSVWRNFYVWSDTAEKYKEARIIFQDFETSNWAWDPIAKAYYWHRFYYHQPDLNFENPLVQKEMFHVLDFWFEMGIDGLRLDAIPYLFEQEGTNCENLGTTHEFLKKLRSHVDKKFKDRILIAEANQWPEDAAAYFGQGDECHMAFHFPVMPRLFMAVQMEDRFPVIDILEQTPILPTTCQWIMFLRNHDELTLEMVSDEERDYMYRIYAKDPKARINLGIRRRLAPLMDDNRAKIELMNILLFSLPGTPVIYYGDELGMGDNYYLGDRDGVRTPMQWSSDRNAGFSKANPHQLYLPVIIDPLYHYEVINVDNQARNSSSLLWWVKKALQVRKNHKAFGFGTLEFVKSENPKVLAFILTYENETILVITNLSRFAQAARLTLEAFGGWRVRELFNQNSFPNIKENGQYSVTLGPHGYYWLSLHQAVIGEEAKQAERALTLNVEKNWINIFKGKAKVKLEKECLTQFLTQARWFARKTAHIDHIKIIGNITIEKTQLCFLEVNYLEIEEKDVYLLPIAYATEEKADYIRSHHPNAVIANVIIDDNEGIIYDGIFNQEFRGKILSIILEHKKIRQDSAELTSSTSAFSKKEIELQKDLHSHVVKGEQSNSAIIYEQKYFFKLFRKLDDGINPDIELTKFLTEKAHFPNIAPFIGNLDCKLHHGHSMSVGILVDLVPHESSGWLFTLDSLKKYYEDIITRKEDYPSFEKENNTIKLIEELIGAHYLEAARLLGQRTAEMHIALSSEYENPSLRPEPSSFLYQRSLYQAMRSNLKTIFSLLKKQFETLPKDTQRLAEEILNQENNILSHFQKVLQKKYNMVRIRIHGDYHLGQVLYTGKDFCIIDFEGQPQQSLSSRRIKRFSLRDAAGMLRSFQYATHKSLYSINAIPSEEIANLRPWADLWYQYVSAIFLKEYINKVTGCPVPLIPSNEQDLIDLLQAFVLEKSIYELGYELNMRPDWSYIPCEGILYHLKNKIPH